MDQQTDQFWRSTQTLGARDAFPFVVGCGRSGTTLVRAMLDSHPQLAVPPESYFVTEMAEQWPREDPFAWEIFAGHLKGHDRFKRWGLPPEVVHEAAESSKPQTYADAIRLVYSCYARSKGKLRYGDKTPRYVRKLELISRVFPEARFVHVIRDGRDVALSLLERDWGPKTIDEAANLWRKRVRAGRRAGAILGRGCYIEVRYEDLVDDPECEMQRICSFVALSPAPDMFRYFERADAVFAGTKYPEQHAALALPPTKGLRNWRDTMSTSEVRRFESTSGDLLSDLGYGLSTED